MNTGAGDVPLAQVSVLGLIPKLRGPTNLPMQHRPKSRWQGISMRRVRRNLYVSILNVVHLMWILPLGLMLIQTESVLAQGAAPNDALTKACDLAAANLYDKQRPADVQGISFNALNPNVAIPACEAALRAAPKDPKLLYELARSYRRDKRFQEALPMLQQAAQTGYPIAANDLAAMYGKGNGVPVDIKAELYYYEQAARAGVGVAAYSLGIIYGNGNAVVPKDEKIARQWMYFATNDHYAPAMHLLGVMLAKGMGGNKDEVESRAWYEKAAQAGNYEAMSLFGYDLAWGVGGQKDQVVAREWFEKSANGNNAAGTNNLGVMFERGWGGPKDLEAARRLYQKAMDLGDKQFAAKNLAKLQETGAVQAGGRTP